jgi:very-short-patch-repair endonuclease
VITLYKVAGLSISEVAGVTGTTRTNVKRLIRKNGIVATGVERSLKVARGFAATEKSGNSRSPYETPILEGLRGRGLSPVHQHAIGACNVDIAIPELGVAVEVERRYGGDSHSMAAERLENLLDRGWSLIVVYSPRGLPIDAESVCKQIVAILQTVSPHPSGAGQYWVIGRDGKDFPGRGPNLDGWSRVACPHAELELALDACSGQ